MQDIDEAIVEARRASDMGCVGYYMRPNPVGGRPLWADEYDPLWAVIEAIGKPISTHDSASSSVPSFGTAWQRTPPGTSCPTPSRPWRRWPGSSGSGSSNASQRYGWCTSKATGLGAVLVATHGAALGLQRERGARVPDPPSTEYFRSNICVAFRGDEPTMKAAVEIVGDDNFSWDTDYPHPDGTFPWGIEAMLARPLSEESKRKMLWDKAARVFKL